MSLCKKKAETEYFNPDQYQCWLTGYGVGKYYNRDTTPKSQVLEYLGRYAPKKKTKRTKHKR